jgi:hypothetical protein
MTLDYGGYAGKILRVDLTKGKVTEEEQSRTRVEKYLGGRGGDAKILFDELNPNPLGPNNILCISSGPLTGLLGPTTGRVNVCAKSPLTNIYGNSNAGTNFGPELKYAGYDGLVIKGRSKKPVYLYIRDDCFELRDATHLWGKGVFETTETVQEECDGYDTKVAAVGPAAENGVLYGALIFDHWDAAGRTGTGTVMASKNLKAIGVRGHGELRSSMTRDSRPWSIPRWAPACVSAGETLRAGSLREISGTASSNTRTRSVVRNSGTGCPPRSRPSRAEGPACRARTGASGTAGSRKASMRVQRATSSSKVWARSAQKPAWGTSTLCSTRTCCPTITAWTAFPQAT